MESMWVCKWKDIHALIVPIMRMKIGIILILYLLISNEELELKLDVLNNPGKCKGIDKRESILAPMVYWHGDTNDPMVVPEYDEIVVQEKREKVKQCKNKTRLERLIEKLKQYK